MNHEIAPEFPGGGNTSMVGLYLDEIPLSSPATSEFGKVFIDPGTYDLDRVEVLRGPQGTLYGSSSMGGTIRLIPRHPRLGLFEASGEQVVSHTVDGGGINHQENGMVNIPLGKHGSRARGRLIHRGQRLHQAV